MPTIPRASPGCGCRVHPLERDVVGRDAERAVESRGGEVNRLLQSGVGQRWRLALSRQQLRLLLVELILREDAALAKRIELLEFVGNQ